jgi:hypothetical protein
MLSQNVPQFELYKHNDELFNAYYGIFLWTLNFCQFWPIMQIRKKGDGIKKNHLKKFLFLVMVAILDTERRWRTQIERGPPKDH